MNITLFNTDGLAKLAETVGGWFGWNARAIEHNAEAEAFATARKADAENAANPIRLQGEDQVANYLLAREKRKMLNAHNVIEPIPKAQVQAIIPVLWG